MSQRPAADFARRLEEARRVHAHGDLATAVRQYSDLERLRPDDAKVLHGLGVALAQTGRFADAEKRLLRAVERSPEATDVRFDLAALREAEGRPEEAERVLRELVAIDPNHGAAWGSIGMFRRDAKDPQGAAQAYREAYRLVPRNLEYAMHAAHLLPPEEGAAILTECLERFPGDETLLLPLAELFMRADRMDEAEQILQILKARQPKSARVRRHLGAVYARLLRIPEAAGALYEAIQRDPNDDETWYMLSQIRDSLGDSEGAIAAMDRALAIRPEDLAYVTLRARLQQHGGRIDAAQADLAELPDPVRATSDVRLVTGMLLPPIPESNAQIDALRERWMATMADVEARPTFMAEPWETVGLNGYYLGYHGREDRPLMEAFARATLASSPHLDHTAKRLGGDGGSKLRVGFLSAHMRLHSVGRVLVKLMGALDREKFEVVLLQLPDKMDGGQEWGEQNADRTVRIPPQLEAARAAVEAERLDVLIYCDLHLHGFTDALSFSRLAPVQATTWGHPGTGGRTSIDYWISCEDWEVAGNERLYTEQLVRLAQPPFVYTEPVPPQVFRTRASFGLRDDARLYGALQSLFKFHPDFDLLLGEILERDPKGRLVLIEGPNHRWRKRLLARFAKSFDPDRVDFLPTVHNKDYLSAVSACDIMLDPIHFAGANTSLEAFAIGKPVVTLQGDQMRNRATGGFYRQMGYEKLVAKDHREYVDLAVRLAQDRRFYREAKEAILENKAVLFENLAPVADFEAWLLSVRR